MEISPTLTWFIVGAVFVALELFGLSGIGFFFAGLSGLTIGILVETGYLDAGNHFAQTAWFFALTVAWAIVLWKPIQKIFPKANKDNGYNNMVGDTVYVGGGGLKKGHVGEVTWSGTIMKAELISESTADALEAGAKAEIVDVRGNTLWVKPKH